MKLGLVLTITLFLRRLKPLFNRKKLSVSFIETIKEPLQSCKGSYDEFDN